MRLRDLFLDPPAEFRQAPFWFWNHRLEPDTLAWQLEQMKAKGLGGFVMHARHGLITPYLSPDWFECIRFCCRTAKVLGLIAWAYDEQDWPSGPAGGAVIADRANRLNYVHLEDETIEGPASVALGDDVVCAYASRPGKPPQRLAGPTWQAEPGRWRLLKAVRFECPAILWFESYLNTLDPKACQAFVRSTYDRHEQELGDLKELGLAGFFTDEPAFGTYPDDLHRIPWSPNLAPAFAERKGYDLLDYLPAFFSGDEGGAAVRYDYWDVATGLFSEAYFRTLGTWCETRGLELIGHPLGEEPLFFQFRCIGDIFRHLRHMHMPGMDNLSIQAGKGRRQAMSPKLVASAALLAGRERTMSETFGESGWRLTLRDMKWMADWQMANGINYLIPHAFYYSVAGRRKKDSPPSEFVQAPFWPYYRHFADYTARITAMLTGGVHVADVALLYPMASVWTDFVPGETAPAQVQAVEEAFAPLGETLLRLHRDFVIVDEDALAQADAGDGTFSVNGLTFEALVIPPLTTLREDTLAALERIAERSVVLALETDAVRVLRNAGAPPSERVSRAQLSEVPGLRLLDETTDDALAAALASVPPDVAMDGAPDVLYLHRQKDGLEVYFFANISDEPVDTVVSLRTHGNAEIWDPETGACHDAPGQRENDGRLEVPLALAPAGSCLLVVDPARPTPDAPRLEPGATHRLNVCDLWAFNPENGNFLVLNRWQMTAETKHHATELRYTMQFSMPEHLTNMRLILDGIPAQAENVPEAARSLVAHETGKIVLLDGEPVTEELPWEVDPQFRVLDLQGRLEPGIHQLAIVLRNSGWFPQPGLEEYAWLAGDFALEAMDDVPRLAPVRGLTVGPWEERGFPYFSGTGMYYTELTVDEEIAGRRVFLDAGRVGALLDVEVNGRPAGLRAWPPYRVEITGLIDKGPNLFVLKVSNSARNFFEGPDPDHPSGLLDNVSLEVVD